jgi:putative CocE/NonD family hydrolase
MAEGTSEHVWIPVSDGTRLAATVHRPATAGPVAAILEALPYRKDDLTAGYRPEYIRLRDEHGYAVVRVDVRGTGSSEGVATDEYPQSEQLDLADVIAWIASQQWCNGAVGMYGTSYSGFNALHLAAARPPALKAVIAIYSSDDRYTDDVHFMGGSLRWLDLVDYPLYMVAMNALPPVPSLIGEDWRKRWQDRINDAEPWLLRWMAEQRDGDYWRQGSVRPGYERIGCPVMLVGGWADGYRNNTFRTITALAASGVPHRLLIGPWSHASTATALPGPRIDLVPEMVRWWDRWLRADGPSGTNGDPPITVFARRSSPPEPDLDEVAGEWRDESGWPPDRTRVDVRPLGGADAKPLRHRVSADTGTAAWNSCAGHLPWGQPADQRFDDAASLCWEWPADDLELLGHPRLIVRIAVDAPVASLAAKLCDVFPDGRSALLCRGFLNLTHRDGHADPQPMPVGEPIDLELELEATSWRFAPGHRLRLAITGVDWPNTVAPPRPVELTVHPTHSALHLPVVDGSSPCPPPTLTPSTDKVDKPADVRWTIERDVLARRTTCAVDHGSTYDETGVRCSEHYEGSVSVDTRSWQQALDASATYTLTWPETTVSSTARLHVDATASAWEVTVELECHEGESLVGRRDWRRSIPRDLG